MEIEALVGTGEGKKENSRSSKRIELLALFKVNMIRQQIEDAHCNWSHEKCYVSLLRPE